MYRRPASTTRSAFTLVELLVVITIIGLLMGLILPAIQKVRVSGKRAQTGAEISQLSAAATSFKQEFKFYPPDSFTIPTRIDQPGFAVLKQMYPRWSPALLPDMVTIAPSSALAGAGITPPLVGIQCLIYFTTGPTNTGWAIDGPYAPGPTASTKKGPYFEYGGVPFAVPYQLKDPFGTPYAYFVSSIGGKYAPTTQTLTNSEGVNSTVAPYQSGLPLKFVNSDSVQIISAGADKLFGPGGTTWTPGAGSYDQGFIGADDMANFYGGKQLGAE